MPMESQIAELLAESRSVNHKIDTLLDAYTARLDRIEDTQSGQGEKLAIHMAQQITLVSQIGEMKARLEQLTDQVTELNRLKSHGMGVLGAIGGLLTLAAILFSKADNIHVTLPKFITGN